MSIADLPPGHTDDSNCSDTRSPDRDSSRLEKMLTKGSIWKKQALRGVEYPQHTEKESTDNEEHDTAKMLNICARLSAQLDDRNLEIGRLRAALSSLESEKSQLDSMHRQELDLLRNAYEQFEKESDSLISELGEQNERLRKECRSSNSRSLLKNQVVEWS